MAVSKTPARATLVAEPNSGAASSRSPRYANRRSARPSAGSVSALREGVLSEAKADRFGSAPCCGSKSGNARKNHEFENPMSGVLSLELAIKCRGMLEGMERRGKKRFGQQTPRRWGWRTPLKKRAATRIKSYLKLESHPALSMVSFDLVSENFLLAALPILRSNVRFLSLNK